MNGEPGEPARPISVAVVDDESSVRVSLRRLCLALGFDATAYPSGRAFLESLDGDGGGPDCLLLDLQMPEMTGLEVQRHLASLGVFIPTIIVTADDAPEMRARCLAAGASEYLRKPIGSDELLSAIERAVVRARRAPPSLISAKLEPK
ncbi:MAG: response regulator transcription factor [bacterium]